MPIHAGYAFQDSRQGKRALSRFCLDRLLDGHDRQLNLWRPNVSILSWGRYLLVVVVSDFLLPTQVKGKCIGTIKGLRAQQKGALQFERPIRTTERRFCWPWGACLLDHALLCHCSDRSNQKQAHVAGGVKSSPLLCAPGPLKAMIGG